MGSRLGCSDHLVSGATCSFSNPGLMQRMAKSPPVTLPRCTGTPHLFSTVCSSHMGGGVGAMRTSAIRAHQNIWHIVCEHGPALRAEP